LHLPELRRAARQEIPGPLPAGRLGEPVQRWSISSIRTKLHKAIRNHDADLIRINCRALNSGIAQAQDTAAREADARGWNPDAVNGTM
jgi:hypothetical protein